MTAELVDAQSAPASVDVEAIRRSLHALSPAYDVNGWRLPLPPWAQRPYDDPGAGAWDTLRGDLAREGSTRPMCIYMHIPFCDAKCGFCDSYSFKLGSRIEETATAYIERLLYELTLWSQLPGIRGRSISTVHLGGGTPTFIGERLLTRLVECCREAFATSDSTEWALEATASSLTPSMIATMDALGFRRLHIGVQSLEDPVRLAIGRRGNASGVLSRIESSLAVGWVVSVDLLCGLPGQTVVGFLDGIETLVRAGVDGFSLYELLIYPQNRRWADGHGLIGRNHLANYLMFLAGAAVLEGHGYLKNVFNHWAGWRDANLYFTFPTRGEDCLAVGAIADGVFGDYHYRHPRYGPYLRAAVLGSPGLEGGLRRTARENAVRPLVTALLSGHIDETQVGEFVMSKGESLIEKWQANALLEPDPHGGLRLTASGAWFTGNLIAEIDTHAR
jgi:oxygen-independent coproporphyrinogen-3 oxidase